MAAPFAPSPTRRHRPGLWSPYLVLSEPGHQPRWYQQTWWQAILTHDVLSHQYRGKGTAAEPYQVEFLGSHDVGNPQMWRTARKWLVVMCGAVATLAIAFGSSAYTAAIPGIMAHFGVSITAATAGVAVFVLGFAIGPLFWAPLGELFGRQIWFWTTYAAVTIFAWAAGYTDSFAALIVLRFLGGATGASVLSNAGGVISDVMNEKERGLGLAFFSFAPFMGPVLGPICGGFEAMAVGWRWVLYTIAIFTGVVLVLGAVVVPETYGPALLAKRAAALSDYTGLHFVRASKRPQKSAAQLFKIALSRPWQLLFLEPITLAVCLYQAIIYGTLYMLFGAFPVVYRRGRGWNQGVSGLMFVPVMIGLLLCLGYAVVENRRYARIIDKRGAAEPEDRLPMSCVAAIALPVSMFWFAWTNSASLPWWPSALANILFGFGLLASFLASFNYLVDMYALYAASVLAAAAVSRSVVGAAFPLFTNQMFDALGIHWASALPGFLALACAPCPFLFYKYGAAIRMRCKYARQAALEMAEIKAAAARVAAEERRELEGGEGGEFCNGAGGHDDGPDDHLSKPCRGGDPSDAAEHGAACTAHNASQRPMTTIASAPLASPTAAGPPVAATTLRPA